jgi:hypothetical protein
MRDECSGEPIPFGGWVQYSDDTVGFLGAGATFTQGAGQPAMQPLHDPVNHPKHYTTHPSGVECIDITRHMGFNLGNAMKYIWRCDLKRDAIEDLEKAVWYLQDEIKLRKNR